MRDRAQLEMTPSEYKDAQQAERTRILAQLLDELQRARESGAEWYRWIVDGCPTLSEEEYARVGKLGKRSRRPKQERL